MRIARFAFLFSLCTLLMSSASVYAQLTEYTWDGGTGPQTWQVSGNWDPAVIPNSPDPNFAHAANLSVDLAASLNVSIGSTNVSLGGLTLGGTAGAVTTEISGTTGILVFENSTDPNIFPAASKDADFNNDVNVTGLDFLILQRNLGLTDPNEGQNFFPLGDANVDEKVGSADLAIWTDQYGTRGGAIYNGGAAYINSIGVPGSINTISAKFRANSENIQIGGPNDLTFTSSANFDHTGTGGSSLSVVDHMTVTMNGGIAVRDIDPNANSIDLGLNTHQRTEGHLILNGVISDADPNNTGWIQVGIPENNIARPLNTVTINGNNTFTGRFLLGRTNLIVGHDNAFGADLSDPNNPDYALITQAGPANQYGYNIISTDDARVINNDMQIAQWQTFKGEHDIEMAGNINQTNNRGFINNIDASKTLTVSGRINIFDTPEDAADAEVVRIFVFDGTGNTRVTGLIREQEDDPNALTPVPRGIRKSGTGVLTIDVGAGDNSHEGATEVVMGNLHYADNDSLNSGSGLILSIGGAVGVDTGVASNSTFNSKLDPTSTGGLMLSSTEGGASVDFTGTLSNAGKMTLAAPETGLTFTGSITPANSTYGLGGGTGTLSLPNATLSGANDLSVRNGGTVELLGNNTYTGSTEIRAKYTTTHQEQAEADTANANDADELFLDRLVSPTLVVDDLADAGTASSIGMGSNPNDAEEIVIHGATLKYVGTGDSTNRLFTIGTAGATIDSSGTGAVKFTNSGSLGRRDLTSAIGSLKDNASGNFTANVIYDLKQGVGGDIRDVVVGMTVNDPSPETFFFETFSRCGGATGLEAVPTGGSSLNDGSNCIPLFVDPNKRTSNQAGFDPNSAYEPLDVKVTGVSNNGLQVGFAADDNEINAGTPPVEKNNTTIVFGTVERTLTLTGDNLDDNEIASVISDSAAGGVVSIEKTGSGKWILSGSNTYTGDTIVEEGILSITSSFLDPNSSVEISTGGVLDLDFSGDNVIENLVVNGKDLADGIYGATDGGMGYNVLSVLSGTGFLNVGGVPFPLSAIAAVPEPSTFLLISMACLGMLRSRQRTLR